MFRRTRPTTPFGSAPPRRSGFGRSLRCEPLEARHLLTTLVVQNNLDGALDDLAGDGELSLREAIEIANTGATIDGYTSGEVADTIVFDPAAFTGGAASLIRLTAGELLITESLTIDGSQADDLVISGDALGNDPLVAGTLLTHIESYGIAVTAEYFADNTRVFNYQGEVDGSVLKSLGVTGGRGYSGGGGVRFESTGSLVGERLTIHGCYGATEGGGIFASGGSLTIESSTLTNNYALQFGGAVAVEAGSLIVYESSVAENVAPVLGGGVYAAGSSLMVVGSTISNNQSLGCSIWTGGWNRV